MTSMVRAAAIQLNSQDDLQQNLERCGLWIRKAKASGAELAVLPENFAFFGPDSARQQLAEHLGDPSAPIQATLQRFARSEQIAIVAGGWPERSPDPERPYNCLTVYDRQGTLVGHYRKMHLFDVDLPDGSTYRESASTTPGEQPEVTQILGATLGLSICYDVRFPELYRRLVDRGAEILCVPASFTAETGRDHWHLLNRARAVECQCWVIAANQWGRHPKQRQTYGHSLIIDPWGNVVADATDREGFITADLDLDWTKSIRGRLPALRHRRLGIV